MHADGWETEALTNCGILSCFTLLQPSKVVKTHGIDTIFKGKLKVKSKGVLVL